MSLRLDDPMPMTRGRAMPNRLMLAPLTNQQSHADGTLGEDEYRWLTMRAEGGFGLVMTCAAHVHQQGQGFAGQLGIWSDDHLPGLTCLAQGMKKNGALGAVQIHHAGRRGIADVDGGLVCAWDDDETGARALTTAEVESLVEDFVAASLRAERAGFDGVELHGAHGYLIGQFLNGEHNHRTDGYGGSLEDRQRFLFAIIDGVRARCGANFQLGLRLSPERYGIALHDARATAERAMQSGSLDYLDMSLWDAFKEPIDPAFAGKPLISYFANLPRGDCRLGVAGNIMSAARAQQCLDAGADYVLIGRGAILHHDFPRRAIADPRFEATPRPVSRDYLRGEGVGEAFIAYVKGNWPDFIAP